MFYHLGELDDALAYALGAGQLFDVNDQSEYVQTLIGEHLGPHMFSMASCSRFGGTLKQGVACSPHRHVLSPAVCAARCLDQYFELRVRQVEGKVDVSIDPRLVSIVERMLER